MAQIIFQKAIIPDIVKVDSADELKASRRGADGFGSTGF